MPIRDRSCKARLQTLSASELEHIHLASLEILERTGIVIEHAEARGILMRAGATLAQGNRIRIPASVVTSALRSAPPRVALYDRHDRPAVMLERDRTYYGPGSDTPSYADPFSGEVKKTSRQSVELLARLCDGLPNIDFVMSMGVAFDTPGDSSFVHQFAAMQANTTKPIVFTAQGLKDIQPIYEMALAAAGGDADRLRLHPTCLLYTEGIPPLMLGPEAAEMLVFCARHGLPVTCPAAIQAGITGPATIAGNLALANAETLAALALHQLAGPGSPYVYGGNATVMDMRTMTCSYASPELALTNAAFAEMSRHYQLPVWSTAGAANAKILDAQAAAEASYEILTAHLAGANMVHDVGYLNLGLTASTEMLVLGDEIISLVRRLARGIEVTDETLALDVIDQVGPRGSFLGTEHTIKHFRDQIWEPRLFDYNNFDVWKAAGAQDLFSRLNARAKEILSTHRPAPLPPEVAARVAELLAARERQTTG